MVNGKKTEHVPVMRDEVIDYLAPKKNENFIDCTVGGAGHAKEILKRTAPKGRLLGIDLSLEALEAAKKNLKKFEGRVIFLAQGNFADLDKIVKKFNFCPNTKDFGAGVDKVTGVLFDLGLSDYLLEESGRGFSFRKEEPLDMRFDSGSRKKTAAELLNTLSEKELQRIFWEFGEERFARQVAREIVRRRRNKKFETTTDLVNAILKVKCRKRKGEHPARRVFQALRIAVNNELEALKKGLEAALKVLAPGGRLAVISFHSLEDRIVKNFFKDYHKQGALKIITKKPLTPREEEIRENPKSRSAKLRVAEKIYPVK